MIAAFLTTEKTAPPAIALPAYLFMVVVFVFLVWTSLTYHHKTWYSRLFLGLQIFQLAVLYAWYFSNQISWANSLPLYHCRLSMFALVILPNRWPAKQYFALLGVGGATFALGYPVFDPYTFPHITSFSFVLGHYCLLVNGLVYLLNHYQTERLLAKAVVFWTFVLDFFLLCANAVTGGNYGLMKHPPLMPDDNVWVNYLVVSSVLTLMLLMVNRLFAKREQKQGRAAMTEKAL